MIYQVLYYVLILYLFTSTRFVMGIKLADKQPFRFASAHFIIDIKHD